MKIWIIVDSCSGSVLIGLWCCLECFFEVGILFVDVVCYLCWRLSFVLVGCVFVEVGLVLVFCC